MLLNKGNLMRKMDDYLEPLINKFAKAITFSPSRADIIEYTLKLWSYLQSLGGMVEIIHPAIGSSFDPRLHEVYEEEFMQERPNEHLEKKILWILRRGLQCKEDHVDGPRLITVKALVIVQ